MTSLLLATVVQASVVAAEPKPAKKPQPQGFEAAMERSAKSDRPLVVLLGADWCPACRVMKNSTLPKVAKAGGLKDVEFVDVDVDRQRRLAGKLARGGSIPQLIRLEKTDKGWKAQHLVGARSTKEVTAFVKVTPKKAAAKLSSYRTPDSGAEKR